MTYLYKSTTGTTVNIGSYVISIFGLELDERVAELDAEVGISLSIDSEAVEAAEEPAIVVPPVVVPPVAVPTGK